MAWVHGRRCRFTIQIRSAGASVVAISVDAPDESEANTGAFMAEHHGMILTSGGLIFITASDGKVRALDEEIGQVLWTFKLPAGSEGIPAMFDIRRRRNNELLRRTRTSRRGARDRPSGPA